MTEGFHFLRPEWFWVILPAALIGWALRGRFMQGLNDGWSCHVDPHLLKHLSISGKGRSVQPFLRLGAWLAAACLIFALAGPTWRKAEIPSFTGGEPIVAVLSLAQSMNADDLKPSRLKRSVHKLRDLLARTEGDERGLVIYSDTPFAAAPLTSDTKVIEQMLPELSTTLMPVLGDRLDLAIIEAQAMLERGGAARGDIVVFSDSAGTDPALSIDAAKNALADGFAVSVLGAGTEEGATLQTADGRAIANRDGETFLTRIRKSELETVARVGGGAFAMITANNSDLKEILPDTSDFQSAGDKQDFEADGWVDMGYWLLFVPILMMPFAFRRGLVMALAVVVAGAALQPRTAQAGVWQDVWETADQQGQAAFQVGDFAAASKAFESPDWRGSAAYRSGDFRAAASDFAAVDAKYNEGNALAKSGDFEAALQAYDIALAADPEDADARFNRDLVAKLLQEQERDKKKPS